jgi:hypothetical protein
MTTWNGIRVEFILLEVSMRAAVLSLFLILASLLPGTAPAQALQFRAPAPEVTAAGAAWQTNDEPIVVSGLLYMPTREMRMFDGQVMTQIDVYQRVPIYADTTREPFTIVYVPVGRDRMRAYERAPVSAFPVTSGRGATSAAPVVIVAPAEQPRAVGTTGTIVTAPPRTTTAARSRRTIAESIPRARGITGIWVEWNGARWYSSGAAAPYSPDQFTKIGEYRGFSVYRDRTSNSGQVWIEVVKGGPLAPYQRR